MPGFPAPTPKRRDGVYRAPSLRNPAEEAAPRVTRAETPKTASVAAEPSPGDDDPSDEAPLTPGPYAEPTPGRPVDRRLIFVVPLAVVSAAILVFTASVLVSTSGASGDLRWWGCALRGAVASGFFGYIAYRTYTSPSF
jgi:hypothetical protein